MRTFFTIWIGQSFSMLGNGLTTFALGVWVLKETGSVSLFSMVVLLALLPEIIITPFAGAFVDRNNRKRILLFSELGQGLCVLAIAFLFYIGQTDLWLLITILAISSGFLGFQTPALRASIPMIVPEKHLGRASGLSDTGRGISDIVAPIVAALLVEWIGVAGVLFIDFATFLAAFITLGISRIPDPEQPPAVQKTSLREDLLQGWEAVRKSEGLFSLYLYTALLHFLLAMASVLFFPMILDFLSVAEAGPVMAALGAGMFAGGLAMGIQGGPKNRVFGVLFFGALHGIALILMGLQPNAWLAASAYFLLGFCVPLSSGSFQVLIQTTLPKQMLGRAFAIYRTLSTAVIPPAVLLSGPLADFVFNPLLVEGGRLTATVGALIGVGPGRGIAFMLILTGVLCLLLSAIVALQRRRRG